MKLAGDGASVEVGKGRFSYAQSATVSVGGDRVATVLHGGPNGHPNVEASGDRAPALAALLRSMGEHRVTRCDVAVDLYGDDLFTGLEPVALSIARDHSLMVRKVGSPLDRTAGETIYLGSRSSPVFARIYEKGKMECQRQPGLSASQLHPWVRVELEIKPPKELKSQASMMTPESFWGIRSWTAQLAQEAFAMSPDPIPFHPARTSSDDRAFAVMCDQYRSLLWRRCQDKHRGDPDALAREIIQRVFDQANDQAA